MGHADDVAQVIDNEEGLYREAQTQMDQCYYVDDMTCGFMAAIGGECIMFGVHLDRASVRGYFIGNADEPIDLDDESNTVYLQPKEAD